MLEIQDDRITTRLTFPSDQTAKLTINFPRDPKYQALVREALVKLLVPMPESAKAGNAEEK